MKKKKKKEEEEWGQIKSVLVVYHAVARTKSPRTEETRIRKLYFTRTAV